MDRIEQYEVPNSTVDIREYLYLLNSWAWLIVLVGLLAGGAAYLYSINSVPIYETSTRLLVSEPPAMHSIDYSSIVSAQTMTSTYAEMLVDRPVLQGVIEALSLKANPESLKEEISVELVRNTQLIVVRVQNSDPALAAKIADTLAAVFTARISELQSQRYAATRDSLAKQVSDMEKQIETTNQAIANETDPSKLQWLEARLTEYQSLYADLVTSFEQVRLAEAQASTNVVVSESAAIPAKPVSPKTARNTALATAVGLMLAAGIVFTLNVLDNSIKDPEALRKRFDLPILGVIESHNAKQNGYPISETQPRSTVAEAFRVLRTNLTFTEVDKPLRRVMVTSPTPQAGKTTVITNLAVVMAMGEKKVVLLDADLRRPQVHSKFLMQNQMGLTNLFLRPSDILLYGVAHISEIPNLTVITSGGLPHNPAELLTSNKMGEILMKLSETFDIVLVDTPPVLTVTDATALAPLMDGVIIVVKPGETKNGDLQLTLEQLHAVGAHVLGLVLNDVNPRNRRYGYYYHHYYAKYMYYYDDSGMKKAAKTTNGN